MQIGKKIFSIKKKPVNKVASVPEYIKANARRGLDLLKFAGDGLTDKTKREARSMANGEISDDKAKRMAAWFARHISDLDSERAEEYLNGESDRPTGGQVAWLLWGGDLGKSNRLRAMKWAERQGDDEEKKVSNAVEKGLQRKEAITETFDSGITEEKTVDLFGIDKKHIRNVRETEDSFIIEFGKSDEMDEKPHYDDDEEEDGYGKMKEIISGIVEDIVTPKTSFLNASKTVSVEGNDGQKRFSAKIDIAPTPNKPVYKDDRIIDYMDVSFRGYASTNEGITKGDRIGDYLRKGAFKKTVKEFRKNPIMLIDHENSAEKIAGSYSTIKEDENGLYVEGKLSNAPEVRLMRTLIAEGHLKTLSIGGMFYYEDDGKAIEQVDLYEVSLVAIPMNPDARFEAI